MNMDESWYMPWYWHEATPEEKRLVDKIDHFADLGLFDDMIFKKGSSTHKFVQCQAKDINGEWVESVADLPEELESFDYSYFHIKVEPLEKAAGCFDCQEQTLTIAPEYLTEDSVIIHEMLHLHEFVLNELPLFFRDVVFWTLYNDLKTRLPDLDEQIERHAHILTGDKIMSMGGVHDLLFLIKSYDLDLRMGYELGTIFDYDAIL